MCLPEFCELLKQIKPKRGLWEPQFDSWLVRSACYKQPGAYDWHLKWGTVLGTEAWPVGSRAACIGSEDTQSGPPLLQSVLGVRGLRVDCGGSKGKTSYLIILTHGGINKDGVLMPGGCGERAKPGPGPPATVCALQELFLPWQGREGS